MGVPLLILSFAIYNLVAFLEAPFSWTDEIWHFRMKSEGEWGLTAGDILVAGSILILLIEIVRSGRARRGMMDHILSIMLLLGMLAEFVLVKEASTTTFFLLLIVSFVDAVGGLAIGAKRPREVDATVPETIDG
jgi:hypothetical protein